MEAVRSSEMSVNFNQSTRRQIPEDVILHSNHSKNVKSQLDTSQRCTLLRIYLNTCNIFRIYIYVTNSSSKGTVITVLLVLMYVTYLQLQKRLPSLGFDPTSIYLEVQHYDLNSILIFDYELTLFQYQWCAR
jgi:hypothetical protein